MVPVRASKGLALRWCAEQLGFPLENTLVSGVTGADADMLRGNTLGTVVDNRHLAELSDLANIENIYFSKKQHAARHPGSDGSLQFFCGWTGKGGTMNRLLLCTDLDRTLIPNGTQPESPRARELFKRLVSHEEVTLVYVTGRHLASSNRPLPTSVCRNRISSSPMLARPSIRSILRSGSNGMSGTRRLRRTGVA